MIKQNGPDTIDTIIQLGSDWATQWSIETYDEESWRQGVRQYSIYNHLCWLNWYDNMEHLQGFISGAISAAPHSGEITAQIHYVYLPESHLEFTNFQQLHSAFESWARERNAQAIISPSAYGMIEPYREWFDDLDYHRAAVVSQRGVK